MAKANIYIPGVLHMYKWCFLLCKSSFYLIFKTSVGALQVAASRKKTLSPVKDQICTWCTCMCIIYAYAHTHTHTLCIHTRSYIIMTSHLFVKYLFLCANFKHQWFNKKKKKKSKTIKKAFWLKQHLKKIKKKTWKQEKQTETNRTCNVRCPDDCCCGAKKRAGSSDGGTCKMKNDQSVLSPVFAQSNHQCY